MSEKIKQAVAELREIISGQLDDSSQGCCPMGDALRTVADIEDALSASEPTWSDVAPTEPGWYWALTSYGTETVHEVYREDNGCCGVLMCRGQNLRDHTVRWSGPIQPPGEPK